MYEFNISINPNIVDKPAKPTARGWTNAKFSVDELINHVSRGLAFSPGVIKNDTKGKKPTVDDIDYAELLVLDIDNEISLPTQEKRQKNIEDGYVEFDEIKKNEWFAENLLFAYTTPSHTPQHNKFRMVFALPNKITHKDEYKNIAKAFISHFGGDPACCNIDRIFYGNTRAEVYAPKKKLSHKEFTHILEYYDALTANPTHNGIHKNNFAATDVAEMLRYIPRRMDYLSWFKVVSAVGNHFSNDLQTAEKLINEWSPDDERGTRWRLEHRGKNVNIGTVVWLAKQHGYSPPRSLKVSEIAVTENGQLQRQHRVAMRQAEEYLTEHYDFRYDVIKQIVEFKHKKQRKYIRMVDRHVNSLVRELEEHNIKISATALQNRLDSDFVPEFDPFRNYFCNLPEWDGENHIKNYADIAIVQNSQQKLWYDFFARWIVAAVGCALGLPRRDNTGRVVNHTCLVLVGEQGIGKTTFINKLVPPELAEYYALAQINPNDKDSKVLVAENFIVNLDELESSTREEMAALKSLMTTETVSLRRAYGRRTENLQRRASFAGSVNKATFITDITGSRRFLPVEVVSMQLHKEVDIRQMYAQCMYLLTNPLDNQNNYFKYWFDGKEIELLNEHNSAFTTIAPEEELLLKTFAPSPNVDALTPSQIRSLENNNAIKLLTCTEIYNELQRQTSARLSMHKISHFLKKHGFQSVHMKHGKVAKRVYILKPAGDNEHEF